jgi:hypothetical protein
VGGMRVWKQAASPRAMLSAESLVSFGGDPLGVRPT